MKSKILTFVLLVLATFPLSAFSQEYKSFQVENIAAEAVWPAVFQTFKELKLPNPVIDKQKGSGQTNYYNFEVLLIKNRARFRFDYQTGVLTVSLVGRQYLTDKGWADNLMPMTRKQASKILDPVRDRLIELTIDKPYVGAKQEAQARPEIATDKEKAGIYDNFVILKTGDPQMDLLAIHENGSLIGFDLWDDKKNVKALIYKENEDSAAVVVLFDEKGFPNGMITDKYVINIAPAGENLAELTVLDLQGNSIGSRKTELSANRKSSDDMPGEVKSHGPSNYFVPLTPEDDYLSVALSAATTVTKLIGCTAGVATAVTGIGIALAAVSCTSLFLDVVVNELPQSHYLYDELSMVSELTGLTSLPTLKGLKGVSNLFKLKPDEILEVVSSLVSGVKNAYETAKDLKAKYFPEPIISIEGLSSVIAGSSGEWGKEYIVLSAESNFPNNPIDWSKDSEYLKIVPVEMGDNDYKPNKSSVKIYAMKSPAKNRTVTAKQIINGKEVVSRKIIEIKNPVSATASKPADAASGGSVVAGLCDSIFAGTRCPKRASRFIKFSESNNSGKGLQALLDSLGATGWSISKDVNLFPLYLIVSHDTLSKPATNEKFSYRIFEPGNDLEYLADSANKYGSKGWKLMSVNLMTAIMMRDETKPEKPYSRYEYLKVANLADAFSSKSNYDKNHAAIIDMLNQKGSQGWDFFLIGAEYCIMQRVSENTGVQYEYKLVDMNGVYEVKKLFNTEGAAGWDYCLYPLVAYHPAFIPPIVMKRIKGSLGQFEYNFKFIPQIDLFSSKSYDRAILEMRKAFRGTLSNGWQYSGGLAIDESFDEFDDKVFFVFKVDKSCK